LQRRKVIVAIRLKRLGSKRRPFYRIVVLDSRKRRDGAVLEEIGFYNPRAKDSEPEQCFKIDVEAAAKWLRNGAQPSETVRTLLVKAKVFEQLSA
jgi:small subunit ribosomal protein S16